jgi:hypothetical protein
MIGAPMIPCRVRLAAVVAFSLPLAAQKGIPEPRVGVALTPPAGWVELPAGGDRGATLRLFAAPRALGSKGDASQTPVVRVMFFAKGGDPAKDVVDGLPRQTPFRSLEDFAQRGLGMKDVVHEAGKAGALASQRVTAKGGGDLVLLGHALPLDDGECGICVVEPARQGQEGGGRRVRLDRRRAARGGRAAPRPAVAGRCRVVEEGRGDARGNAAQVGRRRRRCDREGAGGGLQGLEVEVLDRAELG